MYSWIDKTINMKIELNDNPVNMLVSFNSEFFIMIFNTYYLVYTLEHNNEDNNKIRFTLSHIIHMSIKSCYIFDGFCLFFISERSNGVYFHFLNNKKSYPMKLLKASEEYLNINHRILNIKNSKGKQQIYEFTNKGLVK